MAAGSPPAPASASSGLARRLGPPLLVLLALALLDLAVFRDHWRGVAAFPWDFSKTYHAVPFYWISAASEGLLGDWIPFQGVGYPLAMNLQSGLWYPPLWFFAVAGVTYSLQAATVLQLLHVLLGGLGASAFTRLRGLAWPWALAAGAAYLLSGGFFCNAEHVDIVRGYAWTPWLLAAATIGDGERGLGPLRARLLPLVVMAMLTGAYPGQGIAMLVLLPVYLAAQLVASEGPLRIDRARVRGAVLRAAYTALGAMLALGNLLPAWLHRAELSRADAGGLARTGLDLGHVFTTLLPYDAEFLAGNVTMRSLFFTVPLLAGLFLLRRSDLRRELAPLALLVAASALIDGGAVLELAARVFPPLGLSRFPAADHRALVLVPAVLLGATGLRGAAELGRASLALRTALLAALAAAGLWTWRRHAALDPDDAGAALLVLAAAAALPWLARVPALARVAPWAALALLVADGLRMHAAVPEPWRGREAVQRRGRGREEDFDAMRAELAAALRATETRRPQRREQPTFDGYRRGVLVFHDYAAGDHLRAVAELMEKKPLARFVKRPGNPVLVRADAPLAPVEDALAAQVAAESGSAEPTLWSAAELRYRVTTTEPAVLVENEVAFPGWTARRADDGSFLRPAPAAWPLRAWHAPAGEYEVVLRFAMPGARLARVLTAAAAAVLLLVLVAGARRPAPA